MWIFVKAKEPSLKKFLEEEYNAVPYISSYLQLEIFDLEDFKNLLNDCVKKGLQKEMVSPIVCPDDDGLQVRFEY